MTSDDAASPAGRPHRWVLARYCLLVVGRTAALASAAVAAAANWPGSGDTAGDDRHSWLVGWRWSSLSGWPCGASPNVVPGRAPG